MPPGQARAAARRAFGNVTRVAGTVLRAQPPAVDRSPAAGRPLRDPQHPPLPRRRDRRGALARRRHRRDHRHADRPRHHLPQGAAALREPAQLSRVQVGTPRPPDHADRQRRAGRALLQLARRVRAVASRRRPPRGRARSGPPTGPRPCRCAPSRRSSSPCSASRPRSASCRRRRRRRRPAGAVLSHRAWERLFDARADALGRVDLDRQPALHRRRRAAAAFWFSEMDSPIWTLLDRRTVPPDEGLEMIVRRPAGVAAGAPRRQAADRPRRLRARAGPRPSASCG